MKKFIPTDFNKEILIWFSFLVLVLMATNVLADTTSVGALASNIYGNFSRLTKLIIGGSYLAGIGFAVGAIMKFKAHKDQPTQITIGTPVALVFIAAALLFLPTILHIAGGTMFGGAGTALSGPSVTVFK